MTENKKPRWRPRQGGAEACGTAADPSDDADDRLVTEARLREFIGRRILVGITYLDPGGELIEQQEAVGTVIAASLENGIEIEKEDGSGLLNLPPDPDHVHIADPGHYRLRSTGEVVIDPDLVTTWEITKAADG